MAIRIILIGLLILALAFALFTTLSGDDSPVQIGQLAHPFELQDEKGNRVELAQFRGKGVVLNFWAAWCLPCRNEMPLLEEEYQKRKDQDLRS
nr:redoxin domain-containing protein [Caldalkalibacillus mannanilyticus]